MRDRQVVYSTESGRPARVKRKKSAPVAAVPGGGVLVRREKKGRAGKEVTVVMGIDSRAHDLKSLAKQIKSRLGTGGSVKNGTIEIQGSHCDAVLAMLAEAGISARRGGG